MSSRRPAARIVVYAGPNGAGKSTIAPSRLRNVFGIEEFVNADTIAVALAAGRLYRDRRVLGVATRGHGRHSCAGHGCPAPGSLPRVDTTRSPGSTMTPSGSNSRPSRRRGTTKASAAILAAARRAVDEALRLHRALGQPVAEWRDGHVVWVPAPETKPHKA